MAIEKAIIIGAGISGIAVALALHRLKIGVFICDIKKQPGTIGGAINLMPSALRYLDHLGVLSKLESKGCTVHSIEIFSVHTTYKIADVDFSNVGKYGYHAMRILRADLLQAMLETLNEAGEEVQYGKSMVEISESAQGVEVRFDDGEMVSADLLLGCDGIHSHTRTMFVDPDRVPVYTGIAVAYGLLKASSITEPIHFKDTAVNTSRRGSLLISYYQPSRESIYLGAVMEVEEQASRESWKIRGADQQKMKEEIAERFHDAKIPCLGQMIREVGDLCLYPVHILGPGGKWSRGKVMLLGDAAHAVGESCNSSKASYLMITTKGRDRCPPKAKALVSLSKTLYCSHISWLATLSPTHSTNMKASANRALMPPTSKRIVDGGSSRMWAGCSVRFGNGLLRGTFGGRREREKKRSRRI